MFDKLIASEPESADFKNRSRYFVTSSVVVGVLFLAAVVVSIFAADYGLGNGSFELVEMISPPELTAVDPEEPQPRQPQPQSQSQSQLPTRTVNMPNLQENPVVPTGISVIPNKQMARPEVGRFVLSNIESTGGGPNEVGRPTEPGTGGPSGLSETGPSVVKEPEVQPPPVVKREPSRKVVVSKGVLNGQAKSLPKPAYSQAARAGRAQGKVSVQVTIDEQGNVISANAVDGHPLLRADAERAARGAKFSPTFLSEIPVKVTGVITYNFIL